MPQDTPKQRSDYYYNVEKPRKAERKLQERAAYLQLLHDGIKISEEQRKYMNDHYDIKDT